MRRREIADSDEEDDLSEPEEVVDLLPDTQPSGPQQQVSSQGGQQAVLEQSVVQQTTSESTDPSFFDHVYVEQQRKAREQSYLAESIVKETQRATRSSDEVSLPAKGRRKTDSSSATNVTSPAVRRNQLAQTSDASDFTTPKKSADMDEWDVPSSSERREGVRSSQKSARSKKNKTYGKQRAKDLTSSAAAAQSGLSLQESQGTRDIEPLSHPVVVERKLATTSQEGNASSEARQFYVTQSNLTSSQKLEYRKIASSGDEGAMLPPSRIGSDDRFSGATTVAYSTPSRYASSGPRLSSDVGLPSTGGGNLDNTIDLTSSPNMTTSNKSQQQGTTPLAEEAGPEAEGINGATFDEHRTELMDQDDNLPSPRSSRKKRKSKDRGDAEDDIPSSRTARKKRTRMVSDDEDELAKTQSWDAAALSRHRDTRRVRSSRPSQRDETAPDEVTDTAAAYVKGDEGEYHIPSDKDDDEWNPQQAALRDAEQSSKAQGGAQPKKRGRKRKQLRNEVANNANATDEKTQALAAQDSTPAPQVDTAPEKPKRKRGRPRKSAAPNVRSTSEVPARSEPEVTHGTDDAPVEASETSDQGRDKTTKSMRETTPQISTEKENTTPLRKAESQPTARITSPLKEADRNAVLQSRTATLDREKAGASSSTKTNSSRPNQVHYRVGLSRKSRIAPLLKSLKK